MKTLLAVFILTTSPAFATPYLCTMDTANHTLDKLQENHSIVPILKMNLAGDIQAILAANTEGKFWLLMLAPDGRSCILAIGDKMKQAKPDDRFMEEKEE